MKYNLIFFLISFVSIGQNELPNSSKIEKINISTSYGTLTFDKVCVENHAQLTFHSNFKNLDEALTDEAEKKNVNKDTALIMIEINQEGIISNYKITKKGKLESFNLFIEKLFREIVIAMPN